MYYTAKAGMMEDIDINNQGSMLCGCHITVYAAKFEYEC